MAKYEIDATGQNLLFGRYRSVAVIMISPFGTVTKGFDVLTERAVCITTLNRAKLTSARSRISYSMQQMRNDVSLVIKRTHPGILDIFDQIEDDQSYHVISEFTEYAPISKMHAILTKDDVFSVMEAFEKIVNIMQYIDQVGVSGCCVREGSIFISGNGDVKIDNIFSSRLSFISDLPELGPYIAGMAVSNGGAFLERENNIRLDLKLIGGVLRTLLSLVGKKKDYGNDVKLVKRKAEDDQKDLADIILPKIGSMVQKFGTGMEDPAYSSIAEMANEVRSLTAEIRAAKSGETKSPSRGSSKRRHYLPGETIFKEGELSHDEAFIVETGTVQILKNAPDGKEIYLDVTMAGDILGEMALIDGQPRMATAKAIEPCTVVVINGIEFRRMLDKIDKVPKRLIDVLVRRLRYQSGEITRLKAVLGISK